MQPDSGGRPLRSGSKENTVRNTITPNVLKTTILRKYEDWREGGEGLRCELIHAVMCGLDCLARWDLNGEYRSEFGGFLPIQIRLTSSHSNFNLAAYSSGDISPSWMVVFIPASDRPSSVIYTLPTQSPKVIGHTLSLIARLGTDGYSQASIISVPTMEGVL